MATIDLSQPLHQIANQLGRAAKRMQSEQPVLMERLGVQALQLSQLSYIDKARGGTGSGGITWKPLAESTVKRKTRRGRRSGKRTRTRSGRRRPSVNSTEIGVDTGLQRASASPGFQGGDGDGGNVFEITGDSVTVGYGRTYSKYFDKDRPLLPETLPTAWETVLDSTSVRWGEQILKQELKL